MPDEFRGDPRDRERVVFAVALVGLLLLAVAGGGIYLIARQRSESRQVELRAVEAEHAAREAAEAARQPPGSTSRSDKQQVFTGRVVQAGRGLALEGDDGVTRSIVADAGSLKLSLDARLRDRPVRLTALPKSGGLQVVFVQTITDDGVYDVDYWCEICAISLTEPGPCFCCGEETKLREQAAR